MSQSAYSFVRSNTYKTYFLITCFTLLVVGFFYALGWYYKSSFFTVIGVIVGVGQPLIGYFFGDKIALSLARAKKLEEGEQAGLHTLVENLARVAGIPKPTLYIAADNSANAFATGRDERHASVCVNRGLLELLSNEELEGVLAHEIAHIKNRDSLVMTMAAILASVIGLVADMSGRMALWGGGNERENNNSGALGVAVYMVAIFLSPFIAFLLQMAVSRSREYLADATAVTFTRHAKGLKNALLKIANNPVPSGTAHSFTSHLYIAEPKMTFGEKASSFFSTHPPMKERVARLEAME